MIWPIYLDSEKSLNEGRKVSKEYAIPEPRIKEIIKATQKLRYKYVAEEDKAYPGEWYNKTYPIQLNKQEKPDRTINPIIKRVKREKDVTTSLTII